MPLQDNLTNGHEKCFNFIRRPRSLMNVLNRPVETPAERGPGAAKITMDIDDPIGLFE